MATQSALLHEIVAKLGEPKSGLIVSANRPSNVTESYIAAARCVGVSVLKTEGDHSALYEGKKIDIEEHRS